MAACCTTCCDACSRAVYQLDVYLNASSCQTESGKVLDNCLGGWVSNKRNIPRESPYVDLPETLFDGMGVIDGSGGLKFA